MGQKSCVDRLSPELREKLLELLNNPAVTQAEIVDAINAEAGEPLISKSSLNRYAQRMKKFAEKNRQAREVADAYLEKSANDTRNKLGKVVNEQIRLVAFDLIAELEDAKEDGNLDPKFITEVIFGRRRTKFERHSRISALPSFPFEKLVKNRVHGKTNINSTTGLPGGKAGRTARIVCGFKHHLCSPRRKKHDNQRSVNKGGFAAVPKKLALRYIRRQGMGEIAAYRRILRGSPLLRYESNAFKVRRRHELLLFVVLKRNDRAVYQRCGILGARLGNCLLRDGRGRHCRRGQGCFGLPNPL